MTVLKNIAYLTYNLFTFQLKCRLVALIVHFLIATYHHEVSQLNWLPAFPTTLRAAPEVLIIEFPAPFNADLLATLHFCRAFIAHQGRAVFWDLPKRLARALWVVARRGVMVPGEYVEGSLANEDVRDAWGNGLHPEYAG